MGEEHDRDRRELEAGGELAADARLHLHRLAGDQEEEEEAEHDDDVARDDEHHEPAGHLVHEPEGDEGRDEEELVGRRIEVGAERRLRPREAGDRAVEPIGQARGDEDAERLAVAEVLEQDEEDRDGDDAEERQEVRDGENVQHGCSPAAGRRFRSWPATLGGTSAVTVTIPSR